MGTEKSSMEIVTDGKTPAEAAGTKIEGEDKWVTASAGESQGMNARLGDFPEIAINLILSGFSVGLFGAVAADIYFGRLETLAQQYELLVPLGIGSVYSFYLLDGHISESGDKTGEQAKEEVDVGISSRFLATVGKSVCPEGAGKTNADENYTKIQGIRGYGRISSGVIAQCESNDEAEDLAFSRHSRLRSLLPSLSIRRLLTAPASAVSWTEPRSRSSNRSHGKTNCHELSQSRLGHPPFSFLKERLCREVPI